MLKTFKSSNYLALIVMMLGIFIFIESYVSIYFLDNDFYFFYVVEQLFKFSLIFFLFLFGLNYKKDTKKNLSIFYTYIMILAIFTLIAVLSHIQPKYILYNLKNLHFWLVLPFFLSYFVKIKNIKIYKYFFQTLVFMSIISFIYSIYIYTTYESFDDLYFYEYYTKLNMFGEWNFIRDGNVRMFGFASGNLTMSQMIIPPLSYVFMLMIISRSKFNQLYGIVFFTILFIFLVLTTARNAVLSFVLACVFLYFFLKSRKKISSILLFFLLILFSIVIVLVANETGYGNLSSLQRITFLLQFIDVFLNNPFGYGIGSTGISLPDYRFFFNLQWRHYLRT